VVQAAPTGFSAFVDDEGNVHGRTSVSERAIITAKVPLRDGLTWYGRLGNLPFAIATLVVLVGSVIAASRSARNRTTPVTAPTAG
jgi:apolipoprotein N-acyltransferase